MGAVNLLGGQVATIGSQFHYVLADGSQGSGIPQLLPQLVLPWDMPGSSFTLSWDSLRALLPAAFSMAMLGAIESLLCAVVLDGMTGTKHKANSELVGGLREHRCTVLRRYYGYGCDCPLRRERTCGRDITGFGGHSLPAGDHGAADPCPAAFMASALCHGCVAADGGWNMSEAHKVVNLLRRAPKDDIIVMLICMSLTVLFDMVIAISVGIVLASLLFMRRIAQMTRLSRLTLRCLTMCWCCA